MKKLSIALLLLTFISINNFLFSQTYMGLSGGFLLTNPHGSSSSPHTYSDLNYQNTFFVSFDYREIHTKSFALGASILYFNQNTDFYLSLGGLGGNNTVNATVNYGYLNFIFLPEFYFGKKAQFYVDFGPTLGVYLHSTMSGTSEWWYMGPPYTSGSEEVSGSANKYLNNLTIGFQVGIGVRYAIAEKINIHANFSNRICSVDFDTEGDANFLTNLMVSAGVDFKINKKTPRMNWAHE
jgi:hypothetical protein